MATIKTEISRCVAVAISEYNELVATATRCSLLEQDNAELRRRIIALQKQIPVVVVATPLDASPKHWDMHASEPE